MSPPPVLREEVVQPRHLAHDGRVRAGLVERLDDGTDVSALFEESETTRHCHFANHVKRVPLKPFANVAYLVGVGVQTGQALDEDGRGVVHKGLIVQETRHGVGVRDGSFGRFVRIFIRDHKQRSDGFAVD